MASHSAEYWEAMSKLDGLIASRDVMRVQTTLFKLASDEKQAVLMSLFEISLSLRDWDFAKAVAGFGLNFELSTGDCDFDPIFQAVRDLWDCPEVIRWLANNGASPNKRYLENNTPLLLAVAENYFDSTVALLDTGADINTADIDGCTALMCAARNGCATIVELLIRRGANVDSADFIGQTAVDYAKRAGFSKLADDQIRTVQDQPQALRQELAKRWKKR